ncbi:hypothetical protein RUMTOR_02106 [[Ruminococcus] torques ATCC 27756]|uniref:Uncharacterized protein n=1 Tax=[Ruminococcus] torques ATCC 27756 TaxID=411460 RepID=A5KPC2_9FIRM|nr:hypothetical protein RUMTOR_02106 [[Ruminococcus] torques ATCC 27756]
MIVSVVGVKTSSWKHEAWEQRGYSLGSNGTSED